MIQHICLGGNLRFKIFHFSVAGVLTIARTLLFQNTET
jgi:hypothetical protein